MNKKLTLSINGDLIGQAKEFARQTGQSLSQMIESLLKARIEISQPTKRNLKKEVKLKGPLKRLSGILGHVSEEELQKIKDSRYEYLMKKYS